MRTGAREIFANFACSGADEIGDEVTRESLCGNLGAEEI